MAIKKTELRLVAGLLEEEAEDTGELAERIITALDAKREKDDTQWVITTQWDGIICMYGPYPTQHQAGKALKRLASPGPGEMRAAVRQLRTID